MNKTVAYQIAFSTEFKTNGTVEFKYKKDSVLYNGYTNGHFRFGFDDSLVLLDGNAYNNDW